FHGSALAFEHARSRKSFGIGGEPRLESGEGFEFFPDEKPVRTFDAFGTHELRMLEAPGKEKIVSAFLRHGDAHALAVHVGELTNGRSRGDQKGNRNLQIGGAEGDLVRALRLIAEESYVPGSGLCRVGQFSRSVEYHELDGHSEPPSQLTSEIGRDAARLGTRPVAGHQKKIPGVDADAQLARRSQLRPQ